MRRGRGICAAGCLLGRWRKLPWGGPSNTASGYGSAAVPAAWKKEKGGKLADCRLGQYLCLCAVLVVGCAGGCFDVRALASWIAMTRGGGRGNEPRWVSCIGAACLCSFHRHRSPGGGRREDGAKGRPKCVLVAKAHDVSGLTEIQTTTTSKGTGTQ